MQYTQDLGFGITCIDTGLGRPGLAACYLLEQEGRVALIETGIKQTVAFLLQLITDKGYTFDQVDYVIITHVHLDHAGGAGGLMQTLPNAKLVVHPLGARHMVDPSKLQAGATAVYGEEKYQAQYGDLIPIAAERMIVVDDLHTIHWGDRTFTFYDTPGHARHHFCVQDSGSHGIFTGDTFGVMYQELCEGFDNFVMISTTPVQFDPEALKKSIDRMVSLNPERLFLTHYGAVKDIPAHAEKLKQQIDAYVSIAHKFAESTNRLDQLTDALMVFALDELAKNGSNLTQEKQTKLLAMDVRLNAQGLDVWLQQQLKNVDGIK